MFATVCSFLCLSLVTTNVVNANVLSRSTAEFAAQAPKYLHHYLEHRLLSPRGDNSTNSTSSASVVSLVLSEGGGSYYTLIQAGDINFRVSVDTGSSDLWLFSSECSDSACKSSPTFPLTYHSLSFGVINNNETTFDISFADGTASSGFLASETIQLGNFSVSEQTFGLATHSNVSLDSKISGVLGMGFPRLSTFTSSVTNSTPLVIGLAQNGLLEYPMFGLSLTRDDDGTLALGAIDVNVVQNVSAIEWHKVMPFSPFGSESNSSSYLVWAVRITEVGVNGTSITTQPTYPNITTESLALIDIGTNGIYGPYQDVSRMFALIEGSRLVDESLGQWAVPCDTENVMTFNFGQGNLTLQPTDYLIGPVSGNPSTCLAWPRGSQNNGDGIDWQLGTPFLRTVYSIFSFGINDKETPMIGFYPISNASTLTEDSGKVSSFFSSASVTIDTTLPNSLLSTPSVTTTGYIFNTSVPASIGLLAHTALGTNTYDAILTASNINESAIPLITPAPSVVTLLVTDGSGDVLTSTEHVSTSSVALGVPPGESSSTVLSPSILFAFLALGLLQGSHILTSF